MTRPSDALIEQWSAQPEPIQPQPTAAPRPSDRLLDSWVDSRNQARQGVLDAAVTLIPERQVSVRDLATKYRLPPEMVERNLDEIKARDRVEQIQQVLAGSPILARQMFDPQFAELAHLDVENLSQLEHTLKQFSGGLIEGQGMSIAGTGRLLDIGQRNVLLGFSDTFLPEPRAGGRPSDESIVGPLIGETWRAVGDRAKDFARDELMAPGARRTFWDDVTAGLGQLTGQAAMFPFDRGAGLFGMGADIVGEKIADDDTEQWRADLATVLGAGVTGITQKLALERILAPLPPNIRNTVGQAMARIGIAGASEGAQEMTESILHDMIRKSLTNPNAEIALGEALYEGGVGATVGAIARTFIEAALHVGKRGARNTQDAQAAENLAQRMAEIVQFSAAMELTRTAPETFQQFVEAALEDGPVQDVFIDANTLMQSGLAEQLAEVSPAVAEQLAEALETGGSVRIPVSEFAARIAPTDMAGQLLDHLKTDPKGMTRAEAGEYLQRQVEEFASQMNDSLIETSEQMVFRQSVENVRSAIKAELDTANRFRPDVNDAYATLVGEFFGALSSRTRLTPEQLFEKYQLRVVAESVAGGQQFEQDTPLRQMRDAAATAARAQDDIENAARTEGAEIDPDAYWGAVERASEAERAFAEALEAIPDTSFALQAQTSDGRTLMLNASAQQPGKWQMTWFGTDGLPWGDTQFDTKAQAIREFLSESDVASVRDFDQNLNQRPFDGQEAARTPIGNMTEIEVDGTTRPALNSEGRPIHPTQGGVRNFWRWFGDSKVVDESGAPLVGYHGTTADVTQFDAARRGENTGAESAGMGFFFTDDTVTAESYANYAATDARIAALLREAERAEAKGDWDTYDAKVAEYEDLDASFSDPQNRLGGQNVLPVYLSIKNPLRVDAKGENAVGFDIAAAVKKAIRGKYDGLIIENLDDAAGLANRPASHFVAFRPTQIKSATGNSGAFDGTNPSILYQFAGPNAATADAVALDTAKSRIESGEDAETVRRETGWFQGVDGKWRFEINDADAKLLIGRVSHGRMREVAGRWINENDFLREFADSPEAAQIRMRNTAQDSRTVGNLPYLDQVIDHPALFAAYPSLRDIRVSVRNNMEIGTGAYSEGSRVIMVSPTTDADMLSILLHEIQHGIQKIEGFATGGSANAMTAEVTDRRSVIDAYGAFAEELQKVGVNTDNMPDIDVFLIDPDQTIDDYLFAIPRNVENTNEVEWAANALMRAIDDGTLSPFTQYHRLAGEVEARNTQTRQRMTDAERQATPPSATADVADSDVIVVFNGTEMASAPAPANAAPRTSAPRGSFNPATNTMALMRGADLSTFLHESGHFFLEVMTDLASTAMSYDEAQLTEGERAIIRDVQAVMDWFGVQDLGTWFNLSFEEKRAYHEQFAESFERYLLDGKAPSVELQPYFQRFRAWLLNVYKSIKDFLARNPAAGELSPEVRQVFDRMLATDEAIRTAEQARSMMPLFESAQQAGMTEEEYARYQALGDEATASAKDELGARGVRDMQWLAGARSRALKRLQKEAKAQRDQMEIEARREVMSQPVYRAWQFLTGKIDTEDKIPAQARRKSDPNVVDPAIDSLFTAIAKLGGIDRAELEAQWGLDPAEKVRQPAFGKHVLRRKDGRSIDDMRAALIQYGYLEANESSPDWNPREFEDKFFDELGGSAVYSSQADYDYLARDPRPGEQVANLEALTAGRLDRATLADTTLDAEGIETLRSRRMVTANGLHPDLVAELFGFDSGDALVQALVAAQDPEVEIEALTDLRMLERHGDLATPEAMERGADSAIHNDVRARMVTTELNALRKATGQRSVMLQAAREYARQMIGRLKVRNVKPAQYSAAEARAAKGAEQAMKAGDIEQAAAEKRNQLINTQATREAHKALEEVEAGLRYLKKFDKDGTRKSIESDYLDQIDTLLERFDLRKGQSLKAIEKRMALAAWIEERANEGTEPDIPQWLQAEAAREHYKNLTVEQFRGLVDAVKQIEHLGRLKQRLLTARDNRTLDAIVTEIRTSIETAADGRVMDNEKRNTLASQAGHAARGFMAAHRQLHSLVREMDGYKDGGPLWTYLVQSMNAAGDKEASMRAEAAERLHALARPLLNDGQKMGGKGVLYPALGRSLNRGEKIAIALNWGNEGNRQRLVDGYGWTPAQVQSVLDTLTRAEWQFVQGAWDFFESYRPEIGAKEKRVLGKEPEWVEPTPITVRPADGGDPIALRGGYYPIKYDPNQSGEAERHSDAELAKQQMRAAYTAATTKRSFTKSRAEQVKGRPLMLTFDGIYQGANEVIHDLAWHEWLIDANKLLRRLDSTIRTHWGAEIARAMKRTIEDIARGDVPAANEFERVIQHLRNGATIAGLGWNLRTTLLQFTGFSNTAVRIGPAWLARGLREFYGSPSHMVRKVEEAQAKSEFLRSRARTMNREINDIMNRLDKGKGDFQMALENSFFIFIQKAQLMVDYPTWYGAYEKAMADPTNVAEDGTVDERRIVALADQAVIAAQSSGQMKDLAQIQRGGPLQKLFTNFYSYFATTLQLAVERTKQTDFKRPDQVMRLAGDYLLLMFVPTLGSVLINALLKGAPDDEDEWARTIAGEQIGFILGFSPLTREITSAVQAATGTGGEFGYSGPAGLRFFAELYRLGQQTGQGEFDMALFKAANNTAGVLFHYPAGQVNRTVEGAVALIEGDTQNPLAVIAGPPR